jgi:hypothetical protein
LVFTYILFLLIFASVVMMIFVVLIPAIAIYVPINYDMVIPAMLIPVTEDQIQDMLIPVD